MRRFSMVMVMALAACGGRQVETDQVAHQPNRLVSTFIGDYLEIDQTTGGGNADLLSSIGVELPAGPAGTSYLDWNDVNPIGHQFKDISDPDISSFPRSIGCVASSKVLSKMDLTYVGLANNLEYAYFAVQRANNNGDAGYYWLMTKVKPEMKGAVAPCKVGESYLEYAITPGDVLLAGHFQPSAEPLLKVFVAKQTVTLDAIAAIDYTNTALWAENPSSIAAVAVNSVPADPGIWDHDGVNKQAMVGDLIGPELFAEAAVKTSIFTGGKPCGAKFFGTVITRSSGSGGTSPDLKDFFGPEEFSFGSLSATASLTPTCNLAFQYQAAAKGMDGADLPGAICDWSFKDGSGTEIATAQGCALSTFDLESRGLQPGTYGAKVTVKDPTTTCEIVADAGDVTVNSKLAVTPILSGTCQSSFTYAASVSGGAMPYSYLWSFPAATPPTSTAAGSTDPVPMAPGTNEAQVTVTDAAGCTASATGSVTVYEQLKIAIAAGAIPGCAAGDAVTYSATVTGGSPDKTVSWTGWTCAGSTCTVNPDDDVFCMTADLQATVTDPICGKAASNREQYGKQTIISSTPL